MRKIRSFAIIAMAFAMSLASCNAIDENLETEFPEKLGPVTQNVPYVTASLVPDVTRTAYSMPDGYTLTAVWSVNDRISVVPALAYPDYAGIYRITEAGGGVGVFAQESPVRATADKFGIFYPGDRIKSMIQFMNFRYDGQVQSKSDPMGHLAAYHAMFKTASSYTNVDFSDAEQSSCMMFNISGRSFDHPSGITLLLQGGGSFYLNNHHDSWYVGDPNDTYAGPSTSSELSLGLSGYGNESSIIAYMMMSSCDVKLSSGNVLRVVVHCADGDYYSDTHVSSPMSLTGGYCHSLNVDSGWKKASNVDGNVITLQTHSVGKGIDLVLMGDGYLESDILDNTYDSHMREAYASFFSVMPESALKEYFNVYYVTAVSDERINAINDPQNGATNTGSITKFSTTFTAGSTSVSGNNDLVRSYARKAFATDADNRIKDATIIVIANQNCRAGTCHQSYALANGMDYGQACGIAYCALGRNTTERRQLIHHEAAGHCFGKLADEYFTTSTGQYNTDWWKEMTDAHQLGLSRNVDIHVDDFIYGKWGASHGLSLTSKANVLWHDLFGTANNYEAMEGLGVYAGANYHDVGFCRPTEDGTASIMNRNTGIFNAPSRRAIIYRARRLSGEVSSNIYGSSAELNYFLNWDASVFLPTRSEVRSEVHPPMLEAGLQPSAPQVMHIGHWEDGRFVEEKSYRM